MISRELPSHPNLEQLKKQAKSLLHAAQAGDVDALRRFSTTLPVFNANDVALHDAQSVIAREHGFPSWPLLVEEVEARTLSFEAALDEFVRCATNDASGRAERLLALYPKIATASLHAELVLGNSDAVTRRLRENPKLATQPGGIQNWEPLLYVCHTCMRGNLEGLVAIARQLCSDGANPNAEYHWNWHPELPRTALWGAVCATGHLPLAEVLLEAGANPTDGVTTHIAGGGGNLAALELLHRYGMNVNGIAGGVPPLVYMMNWADTDKGVRWLLEHGADRNLAWGEAGEAPLHVAARRWEVPLVEELVQRGADVSKRRADGSTPHTVAELSGNVEVAKWLLAHGATDELSVLDRFIAACTRGDRAAADRLLEARPSLRTELRPEHHQLLHRPAESGNIGALETMLACGFAPDTRDKDTFTPLQRAAMSGQPDAVRVLLKSGADVNAKDGTFAATPLVCAVEGRRHAKDGGAGHVAVARLLMAAGSSLEWVPPEGAPSPEGTLEGLAELKRLALVSSPSLSD